MKISLAFLLVYYIWRILMKSEQEKQITLKKYDETKATASKSKKLKIKKQEPSKKKNKLPPGQVLRTYIQDPSQIQIQSKI